jgi:hypothetical protein
MDIIQFSDILWHPTKIYGHKIFLLTKVKPEYYDILYNLTHFPGPLQLVCQIIQVALCMIQLSVMKIREIYCGKQDEIGIT